MRLKVDRGWNNVGAVSGFYLGASRLKAIAAGSESAYVTTPIT